MSQYKRLPPGSAQPTNDWEKESELVIDQLQDQLQDLLNNGLRFEDNLSAYITTVTTDATPGNTTTIVHGLKRTPTGYIVLTKDKAAHIYNTAAADGTNVYLKSDVASVTVKVIIL